MFQFENKMFCTGFLVYKSTLQFWSNIINQAFFEYHSKILTHFRMTLPFLAGWKNYDSEITLYGFSIRRNLEKMLPYRYSSFSLIVWFLLKAFFQWSPLLYPNPLWFIFVTLRIDNLSNVPLESLSIFVDRPYPELFFYCTRTFISLSLIFVFQCKDTTDLP